MPRETLPARIRRTNMSVPVFYGKGLLILLPHLHLGPGHHDCTACRPECLPLLGALARPHPSTTELGAHPRFWEEPP
eukprot:14750171-Alexandrium_andersonii.AAC.1